MRCLSPRRGKSLLPLRGSFLCWPRLLIAVGTAATQLDAQDPETRCCTSRFEAFIILSLATLCPMEITSETLDVILDALAEQLRSLGEQMEVVVISGSALTALGLVKRATRDVDLLAIAENGELRPAEPLPEALRTARDHIARDFELDENWLNPSPTELLRWGLPTGS